MPQKPTTRVRFCGVIVFALLLASPLFAAAGVRLDVPFIRQAKDGCGAASIAMVMQYWLSQAGRPLEPAADAAAIQSALFSGREHGIRASDMQAYFRRHGYQAFAFSGEWADLTQHLEKGRPLIVALKPASLDSSLHYVVVVGFGPEKDVLLVNDAAQRKLLKEDRGRFEREWSAVGNWTLLAVPK